MTITLARRLTGTSSTYVKGAGQITKVFSRLCKLTQHVSTVRCNTTWTLVISTWNTQYSTNPAKSRLGSAACTMRAIGRPLY
eukprot:650443-Amphidinium_carterae.2